MIFKKNAISLTTLTMLSSSLIACGSDTSSSTPAAEELTKPEIYIANIQVKNPSLFVRKQQPIYLSYYDLGLSTTDKNLNQLQVMQQDQLISSQAIDRDHNGVNDGILFLSDLDSAQALEFTLKQSSNMADANFVKLTQAEISHKVGGEWVAHTKPPKHKPASEFKEYIGGTFKNVTELTPPPHYTDHSNWIRYEGPGIESDKVGYRIYLDWRNGFDIFGKKTAQPALQKVGLDGYASYHEMQDWGMDILKVGSSLGAGGFGLWDNETLSLVSDVEKWTAKITANGNLQSSIQIKYHHWKNSVNTQDLTANISMQGGSRLAKVNLAFTKDIATMAAGVVKHKNTEFIQGTTNITGKAYSYIASWGEQSLDGSPLGMAVFFKKEDLAKITQDDKNYLAILKPSGQTNKQQLSYYFAAIWQPESGISNKEDFISYLEQEAEKLTILPRIQIDSALTTEETSKPLTAETALAWSKALADSELNRKTYSYVHNGWDVNRKRLPKFEYDIIGLMPMSYQRLGEITGEEKYKNIIEKITGSYINDQGEIGNYTFDSFNIDSVAPGRNLLTLYKNTGEEKYKTAATRLRKQLAEQPKTSEGAFWHKKKYTGQLWLDGVYMGMPFLAEYAIMFEKGDVQKHSLDEVVNEFALTRKYLRDSQTGLYYHGWDELKQQDWANKETGLSPEFWARGMGWLAMAIVDVLDYIPAENTEQRNLLIKLAQEMATDIIAVQDQQSGTWWQIINKPAAVGNYKESSASAMFTYFLAKSINKGYIGAEYTEYTVKAFQGMLDNFTLVHANGDVSMTQQCYVAGLGFGRDGSYKYYMQEPVVNNDPKGNGPFVIAGIEVSKLLSSK